MRILLAIALLLLLQSCKGQDVTPKESGRKPQQNAEMGNAPTFREELLRLHNELRADPKGFAQKHYRGKTADPVYRGLYEQLLRQEPLAKLEESDLCRRFARRHADWLRTNPFAHSDTRYQGDAILRELQAFTFGENMAQGYDTAEEVFHALLLDSGVASRGHRKNILSPFFTRIGVGLEKQKKSVVIDYCLPQEQKEYYEELRRKYGKPGQ